jgi:hypothetical protein
MTPCKQHAWRTRSRNRRYVIVVCTDCGEVRGAMPAYLSAELAFALGDTGSDRHVALP